jgi:G3E family GTPase
MDATALQPSETIPISVLTGFLGSGKTTILKHLLAQPEMGECAVLINELGEVAIDHLLVRQLAEDIVLLDSGCLCCTMRGDLVTALRDLFIKRTKGEVPEFGRVLIETTGLADPAPILHTLMTDPLIEARYRLDGIVCTIDAVNAGKSLDHNRESVKQAAVADRLLLTKLDLADPVVVEILRARLAALNPAARLIAVAHGQVSPSDVLRCGLFDGSRRIPDVTRWLNDEAYAERDARHHHREHDHICGPDCDHQDDSGIRHLHGDRHDDEVRSFVLTYDQPVRWDGLVLALEFLIASRGEQLLRVKGIVNAEGNPKPLIVQGVQHLFHPVAELPDWPDGDRRTRIVFITRNLSRAAVEELLAHAMREILNEEQA